MKISADPASIKIIMRFLDKHGHSYDRDKGGIHLYTLPTERQIHYIRGVLLAGSRLAPGRRR